MNTSGRRRGLIVVTSKTNGVIPTTLVAAEACRHAGIAGMTGASNIVRGGSHSGNVAALQLARSGLLDIVPSDYVPPALLLSAFQLAEVWNDLPRAVAGVTKTPAQAAALLDRDEVAMGRRADLLRGAFCQHRPTRLGEGVTRCLMKHR